jgi:hypothetical protein
LGGIDLIAFPCEELRDAARRTRHHLVLHLHGFEHQQHVSLADDLALLHAHDPHQAGHGCRQGAGIGDDLGERKALELSEHRRAKPAVHEVLASDAMHLVAPLHALPLEIHPFGRAAPHTQGARLLRAHSHRGRPAVEPLVLEAVPDLEAAARPLEGHLLERGRIVPPARGKRTQHWSRDAALGLGGQRRHHGVHALGLRAGEGPAQLGWVVALQEVRIGATLQELGVAQDPHQQIAVRPRPVDA